MFEAKILADSVNPVGCRLTTFELTYPRFIHSEFMTHRMISRNSASSRAIPIEKMVRRVQLDPVVPIWWGKAQPGMQAREEVDRLSRQIAEDTWLLARDKNIELVQRLIDIGLHKQIPNRLLEPWMWITVIASATDWRHFFELRNHPDAEPHMQQIAVKMEEVYTHSIPVVMSPTYWHLPLWRLDDSLDDNFLVSSDPHYPAMVSAGRCARVSYLTHDGKRDLQADYDLCQKLATNKPMHASPLEHPAVALDSDERIGNFRGWKQLRKFYPEEFTPG